MKEIHLSISFAVSRLRGIETILTQRRPYIHPALREVKQIDFVARLSGWTAPTHFA